MAVLNVWIYTTISKSTLAALYKPRTLTLADSYRPYSFMSTILPVSPLIPHECSPLACFAYRCDSGPPYTGPKHKISYTKLCQHSNSVSSAVLDKSPRYHLHRVRDSSERPTFDTLDAARFGVETNADRHLGRTTTWCEDRIEENIPCNRHCIGQVAVNLVQDVLGGSTKKDCACFRGRAFGEEGEVPMPLRVREYESTRKNGGAHSSPIFSMLKRPHFVPMSDSLRSSKRLTMVAPTARAIRLLSDLRTRRIAEMFALNKKCCA